MKRITALAGALALCLAGCGSHSEDSPRPAVSAVAHLPRGCQTAQVKQLLGGFLGAINRADRKVALSYVAPNPELIGFFFAVGRGPHAKRIEARTPAAVYRTLRGIAGGDQFHLLRAGVGSVGPFARDTRHPELHSISTAGVDFVIGVGSRSVSGKAGIDCGSGRLYLMPAAVARGLVPPKQRICGGYVHLDATRPVVCAYP